MISLVDAPSDWVTSEVGELFDIVGGVPAPQDDAAFAQGGVPFLRMKDLGREHFSRNLSSTDDSLSEDYVRQRKWTTVPAGSILMPRSGSVGLNHRAHLAVPSIIVSHVCALIPKDTRIWPPFAYYAFCQMDMRKLTKKTTGLDSINFSDIKKIAFPFPDFDEQIRIANILDQANDLSRKRQLFINHLDHLRQAIFHDMFGDPRENTRNWPKSTLGGIVRSGDKINYGVVQPGQEVEQGVPLIRVGDLLAGRIDPDSVKKIAPSIEENYKRSRLAGDEILLGCVGSIGTVALAHEGLRGANIARAVARIPVNEEIACRRFIVEQIRSPFLQRYFVEETRTVAQPTLNIGHIVSAPIILPSLEQQKKFATVIDEAGSLLKTVEHQVRLGEGLVSSIEQLAFQGEL